MSTAARFQQAINESVVDIGRMARRTGLPITQCPLYKEYWLRDLWRSGWQYENVRIKPPGGTS